MSKFKKLVLSLILALALALPTVGLVGCEFSLGGGSGQTTSQTDANNQNNNNQNNNQNDNGNQNQIVLTYDKLLEDLVVVANKTKRKVVDIYNNAGQRLAELYNSEPEVADPEHPTEEEQQALNEYNDEITYYQNKRSAVDSMFGYDNLNQIPVIFQPNFNLTKMEPGKTYSIAERSHSYFYGSSIVKYTATADRVTIVEQDTTHGYNYMYHHVRDYQYKNGQLSKITSGMFHMNQNAQDTTKDELAWFEFETFDVDNLVLYYTQGWENYNNGGHITNFINAYQSGNITSDMFTEFLSASNLGTEFKYYDMNTLTGYEILRANSNYAGYNEQQENQPQIVNVQPVSAAMWENTLKNYIYMAESVNIPFEEMLIKFYQSGFKFFDFETLKYNIFDLTFVEEEDPIWFETEQEMYEQTNKYRDMVDYYTFTTVYEVVDGEVNFDANYYNVYVLDKDYYNNEKCETIVSALIDWLEDDDNEGYPQDESFMPKEDFIAGLENALVNLSNQEEFDGVLDFGTEDEPGFTLNISYFMVLSDDGGFGYDLSKSDATYGWISIRIFVDTSGNANYVEFHYQAPTYH